ncbi:ABC transporter permease [Fictibacillus sp. 23RED33]|uniref:ABC transporter permease n=1 Tax=Fictibacillus sp. 23RED33 TaxID=2745879 RepID=UPI0018CD9108|nr:ABC transporter permease [Fictibacillus sp. 23RED33]MBH0173650.1 ABC transporter permease [Fictibacillus sp. 23RED33]
MATYLIRRFIYSLFVIWGAITIIFAVVRIIPGDPAAVMLGSNATPEQIQSLKESLGLSKPLIVQYGEFILNAVRFDFGESFRLGGSAISHVMERLPFTVTLAFTAILFAILISFPLGIQAARKPNGIADKMISFISLFGQSLPTFWVGIVLILIFSRILGVLPSAGAGSIWHLIMPAFTLCLPFIGMIVRLVRSGILEELRQGYVQTARSKGLKQNFILYIHVLRNALIPVVTVLGLLLGEFIGSAIIIEVVFSWPGIGRLLINSILYRDYAVVQAAVALIAVIYIILNLVVDILYGYIDPRVTVEESS